MLTVLRVANAIGGVIVGVIVDEQLFPDTEWTSAVVVPLFGIAGWFAVELLARRIHSGART